MSNRIVPGQWVLSDDEVTALTTPPAPGWMFQGEAATDEYSLRRAIAIVNQARLGDPPGVVRRSGDGVLATRRQSEHGELYWDQSEVDDSWEVIYPTGMFSGDRPEQGWRDMAFESDFVNQEAV
ncbi:hypothetical protein [Mycobacteroides abscessus]|uniref:hypothetical protein n=1 Tax=Mycobacteroides abscessus TaxID=36809 RepID=UPI0018967C1E